MTATKQEILEAAIALSNAISQHIPHGYDYADRVLEEAGVALDERTKALLISLPWPRRWSRRSGNFEIESRRTQIANGPCSISEARGAHPRSWPVGLLAQSNESVPVDSPMALRLAPCGRNRRHTGAGLRRANTWQLEASFAAEGMLSHGHPSWGEKAPPRIIRTESRIEIPYHRTCRHDLLDSPCDVGRLRSELRSLRADRLGC